MPARSPTLPSTVADWQLSEHLFHRPPVSTAVDNPYINFSLRSNYKGAFAGHALSQRSLTVAALPEVRCTPGFSRLARTSVNRLTFKSRARLRSEQPSHRNSEAASPPKRLF